MEMEAAIPMWLIHVLYEHIGISNISLQDCDINMP